MFIPLQGVLDKFVRKYNLSDKISALNKRDIATNIISGIIRSKINVIWYKNQVILLKTTNAAAANEIKLKELIIKEELQKNNIKVNLIKCVI